MKKTLLTTAALALLTTGVIAQSNGKKAVLKKQVGAQIGANISAAATREGIHAPAQNRCGTAVPDANWDEAFNKAVEQWKVDHIDPISGRITSLTNYTVAVIMHVIHGGQAVGTYPNLSYAQLKSQVDVLNADYAGIGNATSTYTALTMGGHGPFYDYATTNSLPAPDNTNAGILPQNTGIHFCMATKDPSGATLAEPGVERINYTSTLVGPNQTHVFPITHYTTSTYPSGNPAYASYNTSTIFPGFIDNVIKPNTIWPIGDYLNVWVTDEPSAAGLLGYATFPAGTGLTGLSAPYGSTTTDGFWTVAYGCGNTATGAGWTSPVAVTKSTGSPANTEYNMGRTCSHEIGHYFGLRHTWGDANCGTDYCNDTPPEQTSTFYGVGTGNSTMIYPYLTGTCSATGSYNSDGPDGIMYENFMDYSDDKFMCMFTADQVARIQTTMANGTYRKNLSSFAVTECSATTSTVAPTAAFTYPSSICANQASAFTDASTGAPTSWSWSVTPTATITTSTTENPTITFPTAGNYTVTLAATNTVGTNSISHVVAVTSCTLSGCDTLSNFSNTDTLTVYHIGRPVADSGYISGNNKYGDLAKASYYDATNLAGTQIKSVICLFYKNGTMGTHGTGTVTVNIFGGNNTAGPSGAAIGTATASLAAIVASTATTNVKYCGDPNLGFSTAIIVPYTFTFPTAISTPSGGFFASLNTNVPAGDTLVVFQNIGDDPATNNTAWELNAPSPGAWAPVSSDWGFTGSSFAILPVVCPILSGIAHNELGNAINLFPNPNNGQFNFAVNLAEATNLNFTVVNMLGQVVYTKSENNITNAVLSCDLSHLAKGVYYANITDGKNNKTVKKIIIE